MQIYTRILPFLALILAFNASQALAQKSQIELQNGTQLAPLVQHFQSMVDTLCASWHVCLKDTTGIKSAILLDDTAGTFVKPPRKFINAFLDPTLDPKDSGFIKFKGVDSTLCFNVYPKNPLDSAYAPLYLSDIDGDVIVVDLFYKWQRITRSVLPDLPKRIDTLLFPHTKTGDEVCSTFVYINHLLPGAKDFNVQSVGMKKANSEFRIASVTPQLPAVIKPGDTLKVQVCYLPKNIGTATDSALVVTDCYTSALMLKGFGGIASMLASDITFPQVEIDSSAWQWVTVKNNGNLSYNLLKSWTLSDTVNFSVDGISGTKLPHLLKPLDSTQLKIFFHPKSIGHDTGRIDWKTDVDKILSITAKPFSIFTGEGIPTKINSVASGNKGSQAFVIRPNPASGNAIVCSFLNPLSTNAPLSIFDVLGREVLVRDLHQGAGQIELPILNLAEGIYYVRLSQGSEVLTQKLEISR